MTRRIGTLVLLALLAACSRRPSSVSDRASNQQRAVIDMAGRAVPVPGKITRVMGMSPTATVLIYTLAPELLAGWNSKPEPEELAFIQPPYRALPTLGGWYGKNNTGNLEEIVKTHPDVLISMGDPMGLAVAKRVEQQIRIPVFYLDDDLKKLPEAYLKAGELLGVGPRAADLAAKSRDILAEIQTKVATVPPAKRRRVYYAEGPRGLETEPGDSIHSEALVYAGAINVADVPAHRGFGHTPVSIEQVLTWNPDIVIAGYQHAGPPGEFQRAISTNAAWRRVRAVANHQVYEVPQYPFGWIDRPPSVNRLIGIRWIANLLYPDLFHDNMRAVTRKFYADFYQWQLSDAELDRILAAAVPQLR